MTGIEPAGAGAMSRARDLIGLGAFVLMCFAVAGAGSAITAGSVGGWYQTLQKPPFNPPDWVFAPVWTALYGLMALAAWRVWRRRGVWRRGAALGLFVVQLLLNLLWSWLFFGLQAIGLALAEIVLLLLAIIVTARRFWKADALAGILLLPYALWVSFAVVLNAALWHLN